MAIFRVLFISWLFLTYLPQGFAGQRSAVWITESNQILTTDPVYDPKEDQNVLKGLSLGSLEGQDVLEGLLPAGSLVVVTRSNKEKEGSHIKRIDGFPYIHVHINCSESLEECKSGWLRMRAGRPAKPAEIEEHLNKVREEVDYKIVPSISEKLESGVQSLTTDQEPVASNSQECTPIENLGEANLAGAAIVSGDKFRVTGENGSDTFSILNIENQIYIKVKQVISIPASLCKLNDELVVELTLPSLIRSLKSLPEIVKITITGTRRSTSQLNSPAALGLSGRVERAVE